MMEQWKSTGESISLIAREYSERISRSYRDCYWTLEEPDARDGEIERSETREGDLV